MSDPAMIESIMKAVTIPVMAKSRIGHIAEARILEALGVDFIDESEVLTPADEEAHIDKKTFSVPFVCGARDLGEALRRISEGAAMIRTKGEAGTGNVVEAVRHLKTVNRGLAELKGMGAAALANKADEYRVPLELLKQVQALGRLPVVTFVAGGIATPADAALMMMLGSEGCFVGSGIFKSQNPAKTARAIVEAVINWKDAARLVEISRGLGEPMRGLEIKTLETTMASRGI